MSQPFDQLPEQTRDQMAVVFATLLLHDDGLELSEQNVKNVLSAAGLKVAPYWPTLFLKALQGRDLGSLLTVGGGSGAGAAPAQATGGAPAPAGGNSAPAKPKEEEKPVEEEAVSMGGLFD